MHYFKSSSNYYLVPDYGNIFKIWWSHIDLYYFTYKHIVFWVWERKCDVVCPQGNGYLSRRSAMLAVCYDVADRRRWSATLAAKELKDKSSFEANEGHI